MKSVAYRRKPLRRKTDDGHEKRRRFRGDGVWMGSGECPRSVLRVLVLLGLGRECGGDVGLDRVRTAGPPAVEAVGEAREGVDAEEDEDGERGVARDHDEEKREHHDEPERDRAHDGVALAGEEGRVGDHREAGVERDDGGDFTLVRQEPFGELALDAEPDEAADERGGGRRGKALEVVLAHDAHVAVEAGEAEDGAQAVDEGDGPAELAEPLEGVFVDDEAGGDAEADGVGEGVHLDAEFGLGVRESGDAAVHAVEEHGEEDRDRGGVEVAVHGGDDAVEG